MRIVEFRIGLPMSVQEFRLCQLYMIAKASVEAVTQHGDVVEILINEPFSKSPEEGGQYTLKRLGLTNHVPNWVLDQLGISGSLEVQEHSWNSYPRLKTVYEV
eukprot:GHVU01128046.1.p1 GENE.GHVU01128046.1~~GHVU01128046.1.p1  ORF type:complete len:103 (+),score=13.40 GHVU01128046.1:467-775(+)